MRKKLAFLLCTVMLFSLILAFTVTGNTSRPAIYVEVDGVRINDNEARPHEGRTLVGLRAVFEAMGFTVRWEGGDVQTATLTRGTTTVRAFPGNTRIEVIEAGVQRNVTSDVTPMVVNGRMLIPLRVVAEATGASVSWNRARNTVEVVTGGFVPRPVEGRLHLDPRVVGDRWIFVDAEDEPWGEHHLWYGMLSGLHSGGGHGDLEFSNIFLYKPYLGGVARTWYEEIHNVTSTFPDGSFNVRAPSGRNVRVSLFCAFYDSLTYTPLNTRGRTQVWTPYDGMMAMDRIHPAQSPHNLAPGATAGRFDACYSAHKEMRRLWRMENVDTVLPVRVNIDHGEDFTRRDGMGGIGTIIRLERIEMQYRTNPANPWFDLVPNQELPFPAQYNVHRFCRDFQKLDGTQRHWLQDLTTGDVASIEVVENLGYFMLNDVGLIYFYNLPLGMYRVTVVRAPHGATIEGMLLGTDRYPFNRVTARNRIEIQREEQFGPRSLYAARPWDLHPIYVYVCRETGVRRNINDADLRLFNIRDERPMDLRVCARHLRSEEGYLQAIMMSGSSSDMLYHYMVHSSLHYTNRITITGFVGDRWHLVYRTLHPEMIWTTGQVPPLNFTGRPGTSVGPGIGQNRQGEVVPPEGWTQYNDPRHPWYVGTPLPADTRPGAGMGTLPPYHGEGDDPGSVWDGDL